VAELAPLLGAEPSAVLIREQRKRWGSADAQGVLRFNWRVVQAPTRLVDYVVAHELVHLRYPNHTRGFWAALGQVMPDYERRREELRRLGRMMVW
jgi:predicted metal-dependent hydrolase